MRSLKVALGRVLRQCVPSSLKACIPVSFKARARALFGIEPWPDLAIRHPLFRTARYEALRKHAGPFDRYRKPYKPVIERGHQVSYLVADWFARAGVRTVFHAGYSNGRYLFYFLEMGIDCGGTDLRLEEAPTTEVPGEVFEEVILHRLLRVDFFDLTTERISRAWQDPASLPVDVLFTEATFETLFPWRKKGFSVAKYAALDVQARSLLLREWLPAKLEELQGCFHNMVFIEPEPQAGGAGEVFELCARRLPRYAYSVWRFRPPFDRLFWLSPTQLTMQAVYAYTRDPRLLDALRPFADPL